VEGLTPLSPSPGIDQLIYATCSGLSLEGTTAPNGTENLISARFLSLLEIDFTDMQPALFGNPPG